MKSHIANCLSGAQAARKVPPLVFLSRSLVIMTIVGFAAPTPVRGQSDPFEPSFSGEIMNGLKQGMDAVAGYGANKAQFNLEIAAARKRYWSAYPDGPGVKEAREKYMELLAVKDTLNILPSLVAGPTYGLKWAKGWDVLSSPGVYASPEDEDEVVRFDGGVSPFAEPALKAMARAIRETAGLTPDPPSPAPLNELMLIPSPTAAKAIAANEDAIKAYIVARNRAEMLKGLDYINFANDRDYLSQRLTLEGAFESADAARQYFNEIDEALGPGHVDEVARSIRRLPKNLYGQLTAVDELGPYSPESYDDGVVWTKALLDIHLGHGDARSYALTMIHLERGVGWREALQIYSKYWVEPFGEKAALAAAEQVRTAPKRPSPGYGYLAEELRYTHRPPEAMRRLMPYDPYRDYPLASLSDDDPKQYLYAVLRNFGDVQYWNEVPAAYEALERRWSGTRLSEALAKLMAARKNKDGTLAAPKELAVSSINPAKALEELLQQEASTPRGYFADLFSTRSDDGAREYEALASCFGTKLLDEVITKVRTAQEQDIDLAQLDGAVSGFKEPAQAILDILWATSVPEQYHHYLVWRHLFPRYASAALKGLDLETADARTQEEIAHELEIYGRDNLYAAAAKIAVAPKQPFTLFDYYSRAAAKLVDPKAVDPGLIQSSGEVDQFVDWFYVGRLAGIIKRSANAPATAFKVGDAFEIEFRGAWRQAKVLRVSPLAGGGANYMIQVDYPGQAPFSRLESWLKRNSRPVQIPSSSSAAGPNDALVTKEPAPQSTNGEAKTAGDEFPVGSVLQLNYGREICQGIVVDFNPSAGWLVEVHRTKPRSRITPIWLRPNMVARYEATLLATEESEPLAPGAKVLVAQGGGIQIETTVVEVGQGGNAYFVETRMPTNRRPFRRWMLRNELASAESQPLRSVGDSTKANGALATAEQPFVIGSRFRLRQRGIAVEGKIVDIRGEGRSEQVEIEVALPNGRGTARHWMPSSELRAAIQEE